MMHFLATSKGFTLIELLIVVAVIGILASVGMTQYETYRMKSYNAAALTDLKNYKSAMEAYFAEHQTYP